MDWSSNLCSSDENVLILGASGFVGKHVVQNLLEKRKNTHCPGRTFLLTRETKPNRISLSLKRGSLGTSIKESVSSALSRSGSRSPDRSPPRTPSGISLSPLEPIELQGDITDPTSLEEAIKESRCSVIYNLAGIYSWWRPDKSVYQKVNVEGVDNLLKAANAVAQSNSQPIRIVHVSTVLAYGRVRDSRGATLGLTESTAFDETHPLGETTSLYAASKQRGDILFEDFFGSADESNVSGCLVYLACCIGEDPKLLKPDADVMRISDLVYEKIPAKIASDTIFTYVYVKDSAEAIVRAGEKLKMDNYTATNCSNVDIAKIEDVTLTDRTHVEVNNAADVAFHGTPDSTQSSGFRPGNAGSAAGKQDEKPNSAASNHINRSRRQVSKYFIGNQRLPTKSYYTLIAKLASVELGRPVSAPKYEIPASMALGWAQVTGFGRSLMSIASFGRVRTPPQAAADVVRTAISGTLLFQSVKSEQELGMEYTDITQAFREAVHFVVTENKS